MGTVVIGRSHETEVLHQAIADVERGAGAFVHIIGEPGIGKTTLLGLARADLDRRGIVCRAAVADETDRRRPSR